LTTPAADGRQGHVQRLLPSRLSAAGVETLNLNIKKHPGRHTAVV